MDLGYYWPRPRFTDWVVRRRLLGAPFRLIDAGVQGGLHPRWDALGDLLEADGFDALDEAVAPLRAKAPPGRRFHAIALGDVDGERELFIAPETTASSFYPRQPSRYAVDASVARTESVRRVLVRRLDTLVEQRLIAPADFIKIDCEGFEPEILRGAQELLRRSVLGLEIETSFNPLAAVPETHFSAVAGELQRHGFLLYDLAFNRIPRASFAARAKELGRRRLKTLSRPATFNVLFIRESAAPSREAAIKTAIILELYGMRDCAYDTLASRPVEQLGIDQAALDLLFCSPLSAFTARARLSLRRRLRAALSVFARTASHR